MDKETRKKYSSKLGEIAALSNQYDSGIDNTSFFLKVPYDFFMSGTLLQKRKHIVLVLATLYKKRDMGNVIRTTLKEIMDDNFIVAVKGKNRSIEQVRDSLCQLMKLGYIRFYNKELAGIAERAFLYRYEKDVFSLTQIKESMTLNTELTLVFDMEYYNSIQKDFAILNYWILRYIKSAIDEQPERGIKLRNAVCIYLMIRVNVYVNGLKVTHIPLSYTHMQRQLKVDRQTIADTLKFLEDNEFITRKRITDNQVKYDLVQEDVEGFRI